MQLIGGPITVQNTDAGCWLVTMQDAVTSTAGESVTLTVAVPRNPAITLPQLQRLAAQKAIELLQPLAYRPTPD